jgi:Fic/DOC family
MLPMVKLAQPTITTTTGPRRGHPSRASYHDRLERALDDLRHLGGLPSPSEGTQIWTDIWYDEAHNSTALEGNTLVLREVEALLRDKKVVGQKPLKDYLEVTGYAKAAEWVYTQALDPKGWGDDELLSLTEVRQVHREVLTPVWETAPDPGALAEESPGNWRRHDIQSFEGGMTPPDWTLIPALVQDWVDGTKQIRANGRPISETVADCHAAFERIHPFFDGNGRTGRLLLNLTLVRLGYPPTIIRLRHRARYLAGLHKADQGDSGPLGELIARGVHENINRFILPAIAGEVRLLPLDALVAPDLTLRALQAAATRGRLRVVMGHDRVWRSSKKWVTDYRKSKYEPLRRKRGPRSRSGNAPVRIDVGPATLSLANSPPTATVTKSS